MLVEALDAQTGIPAAARTLEITVDAIPKVWVDSSVSAFEGVQDGKWTIKRSGGRMDLPLDVNTNLGTFTFPANQSSYDWIVAAPETPPLDENYPNFFGSDQESYLQIYSGNYVDVSTVTRYVVGHYNPVQPREISVWVDSPTSIVELGEGDSVDFTIRRSGATNMYGTLPLRFNAEGQASNLQMLQDGQIISGNTIVFPVGETSVTFTVRALENTSNHAPAIWRWELLSGLFYYDSGMFQTRATIEPSSRIEVRSLDNDALPIDLYLGLSGQTEDNPGLILGVNDDFNESNLTTDEESIDWNGTIHEIAVTRVAMDNEADRGRQHRTIGQSYGSPEQDLVLGSLTIGNPNETTRIPGVLNWTIPAGLKVYWQEVGANVAAWIEVDTTMPFLSDQTIQIAVEGTAQGTGTLTATFTPDAGTTTNTTPVADDSSLKNIQLDLLMDSNNDFTVNARDEASESLPPGKKLYLGDNLPSSWALTDVSLSSNLSVLHRPGEATQWSSKLTYDDTVIRLWSDQARTQPIASGTQWTLPSVPPATLYIEAINGGQSELLWRAFDPAGNAASTPAPDRVYVTVKELSIDVDIDSDNEDGFSSPERTDWEETLEVHPYGLGKLVMQNYNTDDSGEDASHFTPVVLQFQPGLEPMDASIRVRLDYDPVGPAGFIGLWNFDKPQGGFPIRTPVEAGGHYFPPGNEYSLSQLNYNPVNGTVQVFISGERENADLKTLRGVEALGKPDERIRATLSVRRNGVLTEAAFDEVKYIVTQPDSFFYHLQTRPELRNALAARGIYYHRWDMPDFSLRLLSPVELVADLGVQPNVADLLGHPLGHNVAGLDAGLYQDYITGERQYALAFAGTDDAVWANEWDDWINNVEQAFGRHAPQYNAAMRIGDALVNNAPGIPAGHLVVTGQSLGGGLASAAAMAGGIPGDTFNAAGLNRATLYARDPNGNPIPNGLGDYVPLYAGSLGRYDNAGLWLTARYVDFDLLTNVQDSTPLPDAIGNSLEMDGPYDLEMAGNVVAFASGILTGSAWSVVYGTLDGAVTMIECHDHPAILYGLLVDEGLLSTEDLLGYDF